MSITLMAKAWPLNIPTTEKMVLLALADAANDAGVTWIAIRSKTEAKLDLLKKCSLSERALQGAIKRLVAAGHLSRQEKPGKGVIYTVHPNAPPAADAPRIKCAPQETTPTPAADAGKPSVTVIVQDATHPSLGEAQEAVFRFIASLAIKPKKFKLPDWVPAEAWRDYEDMRRKIRKPMTDKARTLTIRRLAQLRDAGNDPGAMLNQSVMNSWQGVFAIKEDQGNGGRLARNGGQHRSDPAMDMLRDALGHDGGIAAAPESDPWASASGGGDWIALPPV